MSEKSSQNQVNELLELELDILDESSDDVRKCFDRNATSQVNAKEATLKNKPEGVVAQVNKIYTLVQQLVNKEIELLQVKVRFLVKKGKGAAVSGGITIFFALCLLVTLLLSALSAIASVWVDDFVVMSYVALLASAVFLLLLLIGLLVTLIFARKIKSTAESVPQSLQKSVGSLKKGLK